MALLAMTMADTVDYVSTLDPSRVAKVVPVDKDDPSKGTIVDYDILEGATVFKLKPLDVFLMGYIYDAASVLGGSQTSSEIKIHTRVNQTNIDAVRHGLAGFTNFSDKNGNKIQFKSSKDVVNSRSYDVVHDDIMNMMGVRLIQDLAGKIKEISEVSPAEAKNSAQASLPSG